jgi:hypothetical protein
VILVIPDETLDQLIASSALLAATWPGACEEIKLLIQVLRMSWPSLAEALALGLIGILTPPGGVSTSLISLVHRTVVLTAMACNEAGAPVGTPHLRPDEVQWLDITDLVVGGGSWLRLAG